MEVRDLEYFSVVAEHGHVGRAAEVLGLSQPALSKCLRRLERAVEAKLVKRTPKGVELTAVGAALSAHVRRLRLVLNDVVHEAADLSQGRAGHLRVGVGACMDDALLSAACSKLLMQAPKVSIILAVARNASLLQALRDGEHDLVVSGIHHPAYPDLMQERLFDDEFAVYASARHPLAKRRRVSLADVARERWALSAPEDLAWSKVHRVFEENGLPPPQIAFATTCPLVRVQTVAASDLVSFSSEKVLQPVWAKFDLAKLPVKELAWKRSIGVSYRKVTYLSPAARRLIEIFKSMTS